MKKKAFWSTLITATIIVAAVTVALVLFALPASADENTQNNGLCGANVEWRFDASTGTLHISGDGSMSNYYYKFDVLGRYGPAPWCGFETPGSITITDNILIKRVIISEGVTSIGDYAFYFCPNIESISLPSSLRSIGDGAFSGCSKLKSITIPSSITSIGGKAFYNCSSLTSVHINDLESWCKVDFCDYVYGLSSTGNLSLKNQDSSLASNPLMYAHNLYVNGELVTDLVIPDEITTISSYSFRGCTSIKEVTIPEGVETIGGYAFADCTNLKKITIPVTVANIGNCAFENCTNLKSVYNGSSFKITSGSLLYGGIGYYATYVHNHDYSETLIQGDKMHYYICNSCSDSKVNVSEHTYISYTSNGDGTHSSTCICGKVDTKTCTGGTATCKYMAVCEVCGTSYGTIDSANHNYSSTITPGQTTHYYECRQCYDRLEETEHVFLDYISNGNNTHSSSCSCGKINTQDCYGGTATCTQKANCGICDAEYGELSAHDYSTTNYNDSEHWNQCLCGEKGEAESHKFNNYTSNSDNTHSTTCTCGKVDTQNCSGGTATCTTKTICEICNTKYGELAAHDYATQKSNDTEHWGECSCGARSEAESHKFGYDNICDVCDFEEASNTETETVRGTTVETEKETEKETESETINNVSNNDNLNSGGCSSAISGGSIALISLLISSVAILKRTKED